MLNTSHFDTFDSVSFKQFCWLPQVHKDLNTLHGLTGRFLVKISSGKTINTIKVNAWGYWPFESATLLKACQVLRKNVFHTSLLYFIISLINCSFGQLIALDSKGKDVLEIYNGGALKSTITPSQTSIQVNYNLVLNSPFFWYTNGNVTNKTFGASDAISFTAKMTGAGTSAGKPFNFSSTLTRPSFRAEIGYQRTSDYFYEIGLTKEIFKTWGFNVFGEVQNQNFYNTTTQSTDPRRPFLYGIHGHLTIFNLLRGWIAASFSGDIGKSYNQDNLAFYQARSSATVIDDNVVTSGDVLGYIGDYKDETVYRGRISTPIYLTSWLNVAPYIAVNGYVDSQAKLLPGASINLFNSSPRKGFNSKPGDSGHSIASGFGVGIDWERKDAVWTSPNIFIYGSLNLDLLKKPRLSKQ